MKKMKMNKTRRMKKRMRMMMRICPLAMPDWLQVHAKIC
jgi:hypothetical protein